MSTDARHLDARARRRHPFVQYFVDIWLGIYTTYLGMKLTLSYLFSAPFTMRYPEERPAIPPSHRGLHAYAEKNCICCRICASVCPVDCITIEVVGRGKDGMVTRFDVDYSKCLFCNLCVEACPTSGLRLTEAYDLACGSRGECMLHLAAPRTDAEIEEHKAMLARKEAERKAKREAQKPQ